MEMPQSLKSGPKGDIETASTDWCRELIPDLYSIFMYIYVYAILCTVYLHGIFRCIIYIIHADHPRSMLTSCCT